MNTAEKISYCITCKGRLEFLQQTLAKNLKILSLEANSEIVVLDYDSQDGLDAWLFSHYAEQIDHGTLRYARFAPAPHFRMAHAKNLAHLAASGEILCSLDADNIIAQGFSGWLRVQHRNNPDFIASVRRPTFGGFLWQRWLGRFVGLPAPSSGLGGRIALSRANFLRLGGYDEQMSGWGGDDRDFMLKARDNGLSWVSIPRRLWGEVIEHSHHLRVSNLSADDVEEARKRLRDGPLTELTRCFAEYRRTGRPKTGITAPDTLHIHGGSADGPVFRPRRSIEGA